MIFCLPVLTYLKMEIAEYVETESISRIATDAELSSIEYLVIYPCCTFNEITDLISHMPRLSHLYCADVVESDEDTKSEVLMQLPNLVHLNMTVNEAESDQLEEFLLKFCSQLQCLRIELCSSGKSYLNGDRWEELISQKINLLTTFIFSYTDYDYNDSETEPYNSLINRFTSPFWIERGWMLHFSVYVGGIIYTICPYRYLEKHFEFDPIFFFLSRETSCDFPDPMINEQSTLHSFSGAQFHLDDSFLHVKKNRIFLSKITSVFQAINVTRLHVQCSQVPADLFVEILQLLPNLHFIEISDLPSYDDICKCHPDINAMNQFFKDNKITQLTLDNISNFEQIDLTIDLFPRLQYFVLRPTNSLHLESLLRHTLLKIQATNIFHPRVLCVFGEKVESDQLAKFQQLIDEENLLEDYTIHRRMNRFDLQWK